MQYTAKTLDNAIDYILPGIAEAKKQGVKFMRPELIKMVAMKFFEDHVDSAPREFNLSMAYKVCQLANNDLNSPDACFAFGDEEFEFKAKREAQTETEYLTQGVNGKRLQESIAQLENGEIIIKNIEG